MKREVLLNKITQISNNDLYKLMRRLIVQEQIGFEHKEWKSKLVHDECHRRDSRIFKNALHDAVITINSLEELMNGLKVVDIVRIDHMSEQELLEWLQCNVVGGKSNPPLDLNGSFTVDVFHAFGLTKDTIICKVAGESMKDINIFDGDTIIVDKSHEPKDGNIVVASINGELFVKRLKVNGKAIELMSENKSFPAVRLYDDVNFKLIGIVKKVIHNLE